MTKDEAKTICTKSIDFGSHLSKERKNEIDELLIELHNKPYDQFNEIEKIVFNYQLHDVLNENDEIVLITHSQAAAKSHHHYLYICSDDKIQLKNLV